MDKNYDELKRYCKDTADDISLAVQLGNTHVAANLVKSLDTALQDLMANEAERVKEMLK